MTKTMQEAWTVLFQAYPKWDIPKPSVAMWTAELAAFDAPHVATAARQLAVESDYPPSLAAWYKRAKALQEADDGEDALTPAEAWDELMRNRRLRHSQQVQWSSEAAMRAAKAVDWASPEWLTEQLPTIRAQFERYYSSIVEKTRKIDAMNDVRNSSERVQRLLGASDQEGIRKLLGG